PACTIPSASRSRPHRRAPRNRILRHAVTRRRELDRASGDGVPSNQSFRSVSERARTGRGHLSKFPVLAAMPKRFCNECETSKLFRLCSISHHLRLHGPTPFASFAFRSVALLSSAGRVSLPWMMARSAGCSELSLNGLNSDSLPSLFGQRG